VANLLVKVADLSVTYTETETQRVAELTIVGVPGKTIGILAADESDGTNWQAIANLTLTAETNLWLDIQSLSEPIHIYQVVEGPVPLLVPPLITLQPPKPDRRPRHEPATPGRGPERRAHRLHLVFQWRTCGGNPAFYRFGIGDALHPRLYAAQAGPNQVVITNPYGTATSQVATLAVGDCRPLLPGVVGWWAG
jgi:hypothetical protein